MKKQDLKTIAFIERARLIHGNKYNYSKVVYINNKTKVCIICPIHGEFWQTPSKHINSKQGCPKCRGLHKTTDDVISLFRLVHGDKYDYSKVVYINNHTKVCIICPIHGEFWQTPHQHLRGHGCPECANVKRLTTEKFIERAKEIHGDKYDYSKVNYINQKTEVCIICPIHGEFWQKPCYHLQGNGCPKCVYHFNIETKEQFITLAKKKFGDKYDYTKVNFVNQNTEVCIICPIHGEFWQTPKNHLRSVGCYLCHNSYKNISDYFYKQAKKIHGDKYDYSKVNYINQKTEVCIICPIHGEFWQKPCYHLQGNGCPFCAKVAKITVDMFKERGNKIHNGKYDYSKVTEIKNSHSKVTIICPEHGEFEQMVYSHLQGQGCPLCRESHLEKEVRNALIDNNIEFIPQYRNKEIFGLQSLDFYLPKLKIGIECQGQQHFQNSRRYQKLEQIQERDQRKNKICKENDIELIYYFNKKYNELYKFNNQYFNSLNEVISYISKKES